MRNYYYNTENFAIYTESEKSKSEFSKGAFIKIGQFKSRTQAEAFFTAKNTGFPVCDSIRC